MSCRLTALLSRQCAINPDGECVGSAEYESYLQSQAYFIPNYKYYSSTDYSYCSSDDATCSSCIANWSTHMSSEVSSSAICTGTDGCICLAPCEVTDRTYTILHTDECTSDSGSGSSSSMSATERILVAIAVGAAVGLFFYGMVWVLRRYLRLIHERDQGWCRHSLLSCDLHVHRTNDACVPTTAMRAASRQPQRGPLLNLNGWKSLQQKLVETERAQLHREPPSRETTVTSTQGEEVVADTHDDAERPSLPLTSGPVVIVEQGDGYRPLSPSRMNERSRGGSR